MVKVSFGDNFEKIFSKIEDNSLKAKIIKQVKKIGVNPEVGKPMRNVRKGTRETYVGSFRLSYTYFKDKDEVVILDLYHKKLQ